MIVTMVMVMVVVVSHGGSPAKDPPGSCLRLQGDTVGTM
jgi:hypothetical protein